MQSPQRASLTARNPQPGISVNFRYEFEDLFPFSPKFIPPILALEATTVLHVRSMIPLQHGRKYQLYPTIFSRAGGIPNSHVNTSGLLKISWCSACSGYSFFCFHESAEARHDISADGWMDGREHHELLKGTHEGYGGEGRTRVGHWTKGTREWESPLLRDRTEWFFFFSFLFGVALDGSVGTWLWFFFFDI